MVVRRVVTAKNTVGKSVFISDGVSPKERVLKHTPGFVSSPIWQLHGAPKLEGHTGDPMVEMTSLVPDAGGTTFLVITFPPDSVFMAADFNPELSAVEHAEASPGIAEKFEPENPGMHTTPTVDFGTVIDGQIVLELDDGETVTLRKGDTVVQQATRHAWRNPFDEPATMSFVLVSAERT